MKLSVINKLLIIFGLLVLISGLRLHIGYEALAKHHAVYEAWRIGHIICAAILTIIVVIHALKNKWWVKSLKFKARNARMVFQRIFTPGVLLLFLALFITGLCMVCGWYSAYSHIWIWHFWLGIFWTVFAIGHGLFFHKPKAV